MNLLPRALFSALLWTLAAVALVVGATGAWFSHAVYGDSTLPAAAKRVVIPRGSTFGQVARTLSDEQVIGNLLAFRILARIRHSDSEVKAGEFRFPAHRTEDWVLRQLVSGGAQIAIWLTIPEGYTAKQIARELEDHHLENADSFMRAFQHGALVVQGQRTKTLEGVLFPSTYLIPTDASPNTVVKILTDEFRKQLPGDARVRARKLGVTIPQAITLASLIEREAKSDSERALMAGVYYNRLRLHMPLEVDATIEYALPEHKSALSNSDLRVDSPYNSYLHPGLPPTPIANPGRPSLIAALNPTRSDYLYYVYKGGGQHAFAKTLAEHNANVARYLK